MKLISVDALLEQAQCTNAYFQVKSIVADLPKIDVEPVVHGHWIKSGNSKWKRCSICSRANQYYYKYCPWCGAKMDEEQECET